MDPNVKLAIEEFTCQIREEIKDGFTTVNMRVFEIEGAGHQRDLRVSTLESASAAVEKSIADWKPEVEAPITSLKLELAKLNTYFDRDTKASSAPKRGILSIESASARPSAGVCVDDSAGHRVDLSHTQCRNSGTCSKVIKSWILSVNILIKIASCTCCCLKRLCQLAALPGP
jgi:hypothetical protein